MLRRKANLALLALMIPVIALTGCGRKGIIVVNGEKVSKDEFYQRLQRIPVQTQQGTKLAGQYVVEQMIGEKLIQQLAKKKNVAPTEAQIEAKIKIITKESSGNLAQLLTSQGMTLDDLKKKIAAEQALINLYTKGVTVKEDEVRKAYDQARGAKNSSLVRPEQVKISAISVATKALADRAYQLISKGLDFPTVTSTMQKDPAAKATGGQLWVARVEPTIPKAVCDTAFSLPINKLSKPFPATGSWVVVRAESKRPKRITQFDDIKDVISEQLAMQKASKDNNFNADFKAFTKSAKIVVNDTRYKGIPDMIKKQATDVELPKPTSTTPAASTTGAAGAARP